jgi:hypothetical protein
LRQDSRDDLRDLPQCQMACMGRMIAMIILLGTLTAWTACTKPAPVQEAETRTPTGLESIPAPDPSKYPSFRNLGGWKNPYLVVREDGIGFVDLSNREVHILKVEEIPAELVSLPSSAWPYGRVVLMTQAVPQDASDPTKAALRKNRALLIGTLKELDVQFQEAP